MWERFIGIHPDRFQRERQNLLCKYLFIDCSDDVSLVCFFPLSYSVFSILS